MKLVFTEICDDSNQDSRVYFDCVNTEAVKIYKECTRDTLLKYAQLQNKIPPFHVKLPSSIQLQGQQISRITLEVLKIPEISRDLCLIDSPELGTVQVTTPQHITTQGMLDVVSNFPEEFMMELEVIIEMHREKCHNL